MFRISTCWNSPKHARGARRETRRTYRGGISALTRSACSAECRRSHVDDLQLTLMDVPGMDPTVALSNLSRPSPKRALSSPVKQVPGARHGGPSTKPQALRGGDLLFEKTLIPSRIRQAE